MQRWIDASSALLQKFHQYSGKALRQVHDAIAPHVVPGASTMDLEQIAVKKIAELGAIAAFKGYHGYPAALCTSDWLASLGMVKSCTS